MKNYIKRIKRVKKKVKSRKGHVYFAHPFDTWHSKREEMIMRRIEEMGLIPINPFEEEDKLNVKYGVEHYYQRPIKPFAKDITDRDLAMVQSCEFYIGWYPKGVTMIGTPIEMVWACLLSKKVMAICYKPQPFLLDHADVLFKGYKNFKEGIEYEWGEE